MSFLDVLFLLCSVDSMTVLDVGDFRRRTNLFSVSSHVRFARIWSVICAQTFCGLVSAGATQQASGLGQVTI
jgi:hypothetical protein